MRALRAALHVVAAALLALPAAAASAPNILLILADDLGYSDIGSYGGEIATPHLDRLAAEGVRFTQFYNTARCSPTRAALLTGVYPHEAGMGFLPAAWSPPAYTTHLGPDVATLPERLRSAGYRSYLAGKWHLAPVEDGSDPAALARSRDHWPLARGFDRFVGTVAGAGSFFYPVSWVEDDALAEVPEDFYYTDAISERAAGFIRDHARRSPDRPFFLYLSYTAPHWPLHAPEEAIARQAGRYEEGWDALREARHRRMLELGMARSEWPLAPRDPDAPPWSDAPHRAWEVRRMQVYAAQVELMDRGIGRVLSALAEAGIAEDTLVIFLSDNGACAEDLYDMPGFVRDRAPAAFSGAMRNGAQPQRGNDPDVMPGAENTFQSVGLPWANASNTPFRLYKQQVHEGGIATPLILRGPGVEVAAGSLLRAPGHVVDLVPTLLELAGVPVRDELDGRPLRPLRGESLMPLLRGEPRARGPIFWEHQGNRAVRSGRWKLVSRWHLTGRGDWELYDLESDRTELNDLASAQPERAAELEALWEAWADEVGVKSWPWVIAPLRRGAAWLAGFALIVALAIAARRRLRAR